MYNNDAPSIGPDIIMVLSATLEINLLLYFTQPAELNGVFTCWFNIRKVQRILHLRSLLEYVFLSDRRRNTDLSAWPSYGSWC